LIDVFQNVKGDYVFKRIIKWCVPHGIYDIYTRKRNIQKPINIIPTANENLVNYSDYIILNKLKKINGSRLCELSILKNLSEIGFEINNLSAAYSINEHEEIWTEVINCLEQNKNNSDFFNYFREFITQFSPHNNKYDLNNTNHISHYIRTALELLEISNTAETLNIIELVSNNGILSKTLQLFGHNVLCSDLHHGIITNSINSYKVGTWIRENFIGVNAVDTFKFNEDCINNLRIFDNGIDIIVMRGTGIPNLRTGNNDDCLYNIKNNISELLKVISKNGMIFAKDEYIFSEYDMEKKNNLLKILSEDVKNICSISYKIEEVKYKNTGWEPFNVTLICKKK
jgi:hypothetical protein